MKKLIMILSLGAIFFQACQKSDPATADGDSTKMHEIDFTASMRNTKTSIISDGDGNYSFVWNAGDNVRVWEMVDGESMATAVASVESSGAQAKFSCSFPERTADEFKYLALYPYQYDVSHSFKDFEGNDRFRIKMPEQQVMRQGSFDPGSDLLVSEIVSETSQPDNVEVRFGRIGSILQLCVKGLNSSIPVKSIKLTSDCLLSGYVEFDPLNGEYSLDKYLLAQRDKYDNPISFPYVWLNASADPDEPAPEFDGNGDITFWFRTFPAQIREFSIELSQSSGRQAPVTTFRRYNVLSRQNTDAISLLDGKMTRLTLTIGDPVGAESIAITDKPTTAQTGKSYQLSYALSPINASEKISWTSSDTGKARVDDYGLLTAYSSGDVTITCHAGSSLSDSFVLHIDTTVPGTVDLGLPSGILWSDCNLGANSPEGYGLYYSWGDPVSVKKKCGRSAYRFWKYSDYHDNYLAALMGKYNLDGAFSSSAQPDCKRFLDTEDDPAGSQLGAGWRSPTNADFEELKAGCNLSKECVNGVNCIRFTSKYNGNSILIPLSGWDTDSRRGEMARLWTCEQTPNWFETASNLEEYGGVTTDITQTNKKTWAGMATSKPSTGNIWASAYVLDSTGDELLLTQKYFERFMYAYSIRPVKASRPTASIPVRITSVENLSSTSAKVNVEFADDEYNKAGGTTAHYYYFGWTKEGVTSLPSESGTMTRTTARTVSYTINGLSSGKEYVVYAHYQRKFTPTGGGTVTTEHFYSDNRVRFTAQADPAKILTAFTTSPASIILEPGDSIQLVPSPTPSTAPVTVTYQSTNPGVATVDYQTGMVTAVAKGKAQIYCIAQGVNTTIPYYCPVTVPDHLDFNGEGGAGDDISDEEVINGGNW